MHSLKSDIWSCGVIFYMLLIGQSPFKGADKSRTLTKIKSEQIDLRLKKQRYAGPEWRLFSSHAKELLFQMLSKCTINRPTAKEALNHPWFDIDYDDRSSKNLPNNLEIAKNLPAFEVLSILSRKRTIQSLSQKHIHALLN